MLKYATRIAGVGLICAAFASTAQAIPNVLHSYDLNGSFADALGGNPIVSGGGTLGATGYTLDLANQGPNLIGPGITDNYSIEIKFSIDTTSGYRKLIDFKNRTPDQGLYNLSTGLKYFPVATGPGGAFSSGGLAHLVVTRDGTSDQFSAFVNGILQLTFTDTTDLAVISSNILHFLRDDAVQNGEQSTGFIDYIRIYDGALNTTDVVLLANDVLPENLISSVPEPGTLALFGLGLAGLGYMRRRQTA